MEFLSFESVSGFLLGFGLMILLGFYLRRKGDKERKFDERYKTVDGKARAFSWGTTVALIFMMFLGAVIYEGFKLAAILLAIVYVFILLTYWGAVAFFNKRV